MVIIFDYNLSNTLWFAKALQKHVNYKIVKKFYNCFNNCGYIDCTI